MARNDQLVKIPNETILTRIFEIRGHKVMFDNHLASLYKVPTAQLNRAVTRNIKRFPADFMFKLTRREFNNLMFQFGTSSWGGTRKLPRVFTEQGVSMLSGVLNSQRAISVNIQIMRVFSITRKVLSDNTELRLEIERIKQKLNKTEKNIEAVFGYLDQLIDKKENTTERKQIGYKRTADNLRSGTVEESPVTIVRKKRTTKGNDRNR
jgi:hypothetical protein